MDAPGPPAVPTSVARQGGPSRPEARVSWLRRSPPKPLPVYCFSCGEPMRWVKYVMGDKFNEHTGQPNPPDWEYY